MKQINMRNMMLCGSVAGAALMMAGAYAAAQTTALRHLTTDAVVAQVAAAEEVPAPSINSKTSTPAMFLEACQRTQARFAKFLANGTPEQFGSEEPFTFNPNKTCP